MLVNRTFLLHTKLYFTKGFTTKLCSYTLKSPAKQPNNLKVDNKRITPKKKFAGTTTYINLKLQQVLYCTVHLLDSQLQIQMCMAYLSGIISLTWIFILGNHILMQSL